MNSLDKRLQTLEVSSAGRLDQSVNLTPDERAIVLRNYVRWIARLSLMDRLTLQRFLDIYGADEPSPVAVSFEGMNPNCAGNLKPFGLGPDDIWTEVAQSGISSAVDEEHFPSKGNPYKSFVIGPGGMKQEPEYVEKFTSYESRQ